MKWFFFFFKIALYTYVFAQPFNCFLENPHSPSQPARAVVTPPSLPLPITDDLWQHLPSFYSWNVIKLSLNLGLSDLLLLLPGMLSLLLTRGGLLLALQVSTETVLPQTGLPPLMTPSAMSLLLISAPPKCSWLSVLPRTDLPPFWNDCGILESLYSKESYSRWIVIWQNKVCYLVSHWFFSYVITRRFILICQTIKWRIFMHLV